MVGLLGKVTNQSRDVVGSRAQSEVSAIWGEMPGEVVSFDDKAQTITVQPLYKPKFDGESVDMPQLYEVPVRFQRVGGFVITTPIKPGDKVTLRPQMRSSENYHGGEDYEASDARTFSLADYEAFLDGGEALTDPIPNFNSENMEIRSADGKFAIEMSEDGKFRIRGAEGNIYDLLAQVVELLGAETTTVSGGSSKGIWPLTHQAQFAEIAGKLRGMAL